MGRPSKHREMEGQAHLARLIRGDRGWERDFAAARYYAPGGLELRETAEGWALMVASEELVGGWSDGTSDSWRQDRHLTYDGRALPEFSRLADAEPEAFLDFARRFGGLGLCAEHGLPYRHSAVGGLPATTCWPAFVKPTVASREMVEDWRRLAVQARVILAIGARLNRHKLGLLNDWRTLVASFGTQPQMMLLTGAGPEHVPFWPRDLDSEWRLLGEAVNLWLGWGDVRPRLSFRQHPKVRVTLAGSWLFGYMARQLAFTLAKASGLAVCSGCGDPYVPKRKPRPDRRNFCTPCRERGVPARLRKRDQRARQRGVAET